MPAPALRHAVLNGVVLVSFCLHLQERSEHHGDAISQAELRLRPVLMTVLVAGARLRPALLSDAGHLLTGLAEVVFSGHAVVMPAASNRPRHSRSPARCVGGIALVGLGAKILVEQLLGP